MSFKQHQSCINFINRSNLRNTVFDRICSVDFLWFWGGIVGLQRKYQIYGLEILYLYIIIEQIEIPIPLTYHSTLSFVYILEIMIFLHYVKMLSVDQQYSIFPLHLEQLQMHYRITFRIWFDLLDLQHCKITLWTARTWCTPLINICITVFMKCADPQAKSS